MSFKPFNDLLDNAGMGDAKTNHEVGLCDGWDSLFPVAQIIFSPWARTLGYRPNQKKASFLKATWSDGNRESPWAGVTL
jgi:hypothetical protein